MTMKYMTATKQARRPVYIPDPPKPKLEDMTSSDHISATGNMYHLIQHFGNPETTIVRGERYLLTRQGVPLNERRVPDLLIAFDVDLELYRANNAYIISEQGKPPDFVLEVASPSTAERDLWDKREDYRAMGVSEYWRFDETGEFYGEGLAGDILVEGEYRPVAIETLEAGVLQGYSPALKLYVCWDNGELRWRDPETGKYIPTLESEREGREAERRGREAERRGREAERRGREAERQARLQAEARVRELEEQLRQRDLER